MNRDFVGEVLVYDAAQLGGYSDTINSQSVSVLMKDADGDILLCTGTVTVTDGGSGYAKGCIYIKTDVATGTTGRYENVGTNISCNFDTVGSTGVTTLTALTDTSIATPASGHILIWDGSNSWDNKAVSGDITISNLGVVAIAAGVIVNADIKSDAAIAWSKMASSTDISTTGTVTDLTMTSEAQGTLLQFDGTNWVVIGVGSSGQALVSGGAGADCYWGTPTVGSASSLANNVTCEAGASDYTIDFGTAGGAYTLTVPAVGGARTFAFINEAQTISANQTFGQTNLHLQGGDSNAMNIKVNETLTGAKTLNVKINDTDRTIDLGGDLTLAGDLTTVTDAITLTATGGGSSVTLPASGTLLANVSEDATPQLGGNLDVNGNGITFTGATVTDITGADTTLVSGTAGTDGNIVIWNSDGDVVDSSTAEADIVTGDSTDTFTNKTFDCDGSGNTFANLNADELDSITGNTYGVPFVIQYTLTNQASAVNIYSSNAPFKFKIVRAYSISTSSDGGTWKLNNGAAGAGTDLSAAVTVDADSGDLDEMTEDIASVADRTIAANGSLSIVPDGGGALDCEIFIECIRVD